MDGIRGRAEGNDKEKEEVEEEKEVKDFPFLTAIDGHSKEKYDLIPHSPIVLQNTHII